MTTDRIPLWKASLTYSILGTVFLNWSMLIRKQWEEQVAQDKVEKLEKKLANSRPRDKDKIGREILLVKAKYWWPSKSFKEQLAMEKEAKRLGIKLDDYLIDEYKKAIKL